MTICSLQPPAMTKHRTKPPFVLRRSLEERRQLLHNHSSCRTKSMGEVVGGTTAEMAAVCCCVPFSVADIAHLAMYKLPKSICRNAMWKSTRRKLAMHRNGGEELKRKIDEELVMHPAVVAAAERFLVPEVEVDKDMLALDNEMWERFSDSGFWRSPSKSEDSKGHLDVSPKLVKLHSSSNWG